MANHVSIADHYPRVGIPSARSERGNYLKNYPSHDFHPAEQDTNRRAFLYFNENISGFQDDDDLWNVDYRDNRGWDFKENPFIDGVGERVLSNRRFVNYVDYQNAAHVISLDKVRVRAKWYDHFSWLLFPAPLFVGLNNASIYNR